MGSKNEHKELKALLEALHGKVDQLTAEVQRLQGLALTAEGGAEAQTTEEPVSNVSDDAALSTNAHPAVEAVCDFVAAALLKRDEDAWAELERLTHSGALLAPRSLDHLKAFSWKKLRVNARRYFKSRDEIQPARVEPSVIDDDTKIVKVFVAHGKGAASPLTVARDDGAAGAWRIQTCSL